MSTYVNTSEPGTVPGIVPRPSGADEVDPELLALPAPPRAGAFVTAGLMVGVMALSLLLMWNFRSELGYFLSGAAAVDLGEARDLGTVPENRYVTVRGLPKAASAVRFRRLARGGTYRVYPVMGQPNLFVQSFIPDGTRVGRRPRHGQYSGRLVSFENARGGYDAIRAYLEREMGVPVHERALLLMDGESPADYWWILALYALLTAFLLTNAVLLYRHLRPVPIE